MHQYDKKTFIPSRFFTDISPLGLTLPTLNLKWCLQGEEFKKNVAEIITVKLLCYFICYKSGSSAPLLIIRNIVVIFLLHFPCLCRLIFLQMSELCLSYTQDQDRPLHLDSHIHSHWRWSTLHSSLQPWYSIQICNFPSSSLQRLCGTFWRSKSLSQSSACTRWTPFQTRMVKTMLFCLRRRRNKSVKAKLPHPRASDSWYYYQASDLLYLLCSAFIEGFWNAWWNLASASWQHKRSLSEEFWLFFLFVCFFSFFLLATGTRTWVILMQWVIQRWE